MISAQCAVLLDADTHRILYERNANKQAKIASTTKIMTGLLVAELCDLSAMVRVPENAVGVEGSSMNLKAGEVLSVEELLYGLLLHSGNDAAVALAMYCSGSVDAFAEKMNIRADELGLKQTHFVNPHGLDDPEHYSTAYDLAILSAFAMEHPVFSKIVSTKTITVGHRTFTNHNKLLWSFDGAIGVKTGYTKASGRVLVSAAERNGRRLIAVTIHDPQDWKDHTALLEHGFSAYCVRKLADAGQVMGRVPVLNGAEAEAEVVCREDICYPAADIECVQLKLNLPVFVFAPVLAGDPAGEVCVVIDGRTVMTDPLYWRYSVLEGA